jgi:hypothetical protein
LTLDGPSFWHLHGPLVSVCAEAAVDAWAVWLWAAGAPTGAALYSQRVVTKVACAALLAAAAAAAAGVGGGGGGAPLYGSGGGAAALLAATANALLCPQLLCAALFLANLVLAMQGHALSVGLPDPAAVTE